MIVMEPVKGGTLANLPKEAEDRVPGSRPGCHLRIMALRWWGASQC